MAQFARLTKQRPPHYAVHFFLHRCGQFEIVAGLFEKPATAKRETPID
jgi:hypothetical protein